MGNNTGGASFAIPGISSGGGGSGFDTSFINRLEAKNLAKERDAENLRRWEISEEHRLNAEQIAASELTRTHRRENVRDSYAADNHSNALDDRDIRNTRNTTF